jgi:hypothetical protein
MGLHEHFEDMVEELEAMGGIFQGDGSASLKRVTQKCTGTGYVYNVICQRCGTPLKVEVGWDELIMIANSMLPNPQWTYDPARGGIYPGGNCRCGGAVPLLLTKKDAETAINAGINKRVLASSMWRISSSLRPPLPAADDLRHRHTTVSRSVRDPD